MRCLSYIWSNLEVYDNWQYIHSTIFLKFIHVFLCIFSGNWHRNLYRRWWIQVSFKAIFFKVWLKSYNLKNHTIKTITIQQKKGNLKYWWTWWKYQTPQFHFRLCLPGNIVENGHEKANYDSSKGMQSISGAYCLILVPLVNNNVITCIKFYKMYEKFELSVNQFRYLLSYLFLHVQLSL